MGDTFVSKCVLGGAAGISGWMFVHPMDVLKVRMQLIGETGACAVAPSTVLKDLVKAEGMGGLYSGLSAAIARQVTYTSLRIGLYDTLRSMANPNPEVPDSFVVKAGCGIGAGAMASFICCPVEVSLVRMQADGRLPLAERRNYSSVFNALTRIAADEGVATYWRGASATVARAMVVSSTQLATYDQAKEVYAGYLHGVPLHLSAALTSGFIYCFASLPLDTAKTRMQNQKPGADGKLPYRSIPQTLLKITTQTGPASLWKGFGPYFLRGGGHTIGMFVFLEQYRTLWRTWSNPEDLP